MESLAVSKFLDVNIPETQTTAQDLEPIAFCGPATLDSACPCVTEGAYLTCGHGTACIRIANLTQPTIDTR